MCIKFRIKILFPFPRVCFNIFPAEKESYMVINQKYVCFVAGEPLRKKLKSAINIAVKRVGGRLLL